MGRFLPWNPDIENFVGAPTGIEPASPAYHYTTAPWCQVHKILLVPIIYGKWCCNILLLLQRSHTVRAPPILLYRHYSPDKLISRTRGPIRRDLSVNGDPNVNPKWNNI